MDCLFVGLGWNRKSKQPMSRRNKKKTGKEGLKGYTLKLNRDLFSETALEFIWQCEAALLQSGIRFGELVGIFNHFMACFSFIFTGCVMVMNLLPVGPECPAAEGEG